MDELLYKLLEQTPTIITLGVGIYVLWKEKGKDKKEWTAERKQKEEQFAALSTEHKEQLERIVKEHREEVKELQEYIRTREASQIETQKDLITINEEVERKITEVLNFLTKQ